MKLPLWILNSSLLVIFTVALFFNFILKQNPPVLRIKKPLVEQDKKRGEILINLERIYKQDIFDTFIETDIRATPKNLITPIPQPKQPIFMPPTLPKKPQFIQPLAISLRGIIASSNENRSVAMIADETNKEKVYHLGNTIKDGQILKIDKDQIVILRANGQQENYLLRKKEELPGKKSEEKWKYIIKKIDEQNYEVDPKEFCNQITSLANFMELLSLKTAYKKNKSIGLKIGKIEQPEIGDSIGIKQNDILISINNLTTSDIKNRIKIYDEITQLKKGDKINVTLRRNNINTTINYKLVKIGKPSKKAFIEPATQEGQPPQFKSSEQQKRERKIREFEKIHKQPKQSEMMSTIRQRLLRNMKTRLKNRRVR
ncbi:type II secretion system protein N [Candidatus Dependentiae bacterium]